VTTYAKDGTPLRRYQVRVLVDPAKWARTTWVEDDQTLEEVESRPAHDMYQTAGNHFIIYERHSRRLWRFTSFDDFVNGLQSIPDLESIDLKQLVEHIPLQEIEDID